MLPHVLPQEGPQGVYYAVKVITNKARKGSHEMQAGQGAQARGTVGVGTGMPPILEISSGEGLMCCIFS